MQYFLLPIVALIGATIHAHRSRPVTPSRRLEIYLVWWVAAVIGVGGFVAAGFHLFDGPEIAREIGFTRGDGGFQFEVAMANLAVGTIGVLCIWFRDRFLLAAVVAAAVWLLGDAIGHIHQAIAYDNHDPDNTGLPLYFDFINPLVALALYGLRERALRRPASADAARPGAVAEPVTPGP